MLTGVNGNGLTALAILGSDLEGKYFSPEDYEITSTATAYTVRATLPSDETYWLEVDQDGTVQKNNF